MTAKGGGLPWIEYLVVALSLLGTVAIGLFFSKTKTKSLEEYMLGSRKMGVFPITLSIAATMLSSSSIVATGQEIYMYGAQMFSTTIYMILGGVVGAFCYLPVLYQLHSMSPYEYFSRRFNSHVRRFVSVVSATDMMQGIISAIYVPAITFAQATGFSYFSISCVLSIICFIYTLLGGLKAIAWADSFQMGIMVTCSALILILGYHLSPGISGIVQALEEGDRWEFFNFDPSPFQRLTFFTTAGVTFLWFPYYTSPSQHQRYLSLPTQYKAKRVIIVSTLLMATFAAFNHGVGLLAYVHFQGCDPVLGNKTIHSYSTIVPYYISEMARNLPGLTGFFHANVIAAGLSTSTSLWNTLSGTVFEDLITPFISEEARKKYSFRIIFGLLTIIASISLLGVYWLPALGTLVEVVIILRSTSQATMFTLFNVAMFIPWMNSYGIMAGGISTAAITIIVLIGNIKTHKANLVVDYSKILTTEKCFTNSTSIPTNATIVTGGVRGPGSHTVADKSVFWLFKLSFYLYMLPGIMVGIFMSVLVTFLTGAPRLETIDPDLIVPQLRWLIPKVNGKQPTNDLQMRAGTMNDVGYSEVSQKCDQHRTRLNDEDLNKNLSN